MTAIGWILTAAFFSFFKFLFIQKLFLHFFKIQYWGEGRGNICKYLIFFFFSYSPRSVFYVFFLDLKIFFSSRVNISKVYILSCFLKNAFAGHSNFCFTSVETKKTFGDIFFWDETLLSTSFTVLDGFPSPWCHLYVSTNVHYSHL